MPDNWPRGKLSDNGRFRQAGRVMKGVRPRETRSSGLWTWRLTGFERLRHSPLGDIASNHRLQHAELLILDDCCGEIEEGRPSQYQG